MTRLVITPRFRSDTNDILNYLEHHPCTFGPLKPPRSHVAWVNQPSAGRVDTSRHRLKLMVFRGELRQELRDRTAVTL